MGRARNTHIRLGIALLIATCLYTARADAQYGGGTGEPNDPYQIWTPEQMNAIGADPNDWDKHFVLMADIDLSQYSDGEFNIIGYSDWPDHKPFIGVFDGNGHTVSNLTCSSDTRDYVGLFGYVGDPMGFLGHRTDSNPEIRNLILMKACVNAGTSSYVGPIAGYLSDATVTNCCVQDAVVSGHKYVGGLIGMSTFGAVAACFSTGAITGNSFMGGLIGYSSGSVINCYSCVSADGKSGVGGLVGWNWLDGAIVNCWSAGHVSGTYFVGGFVGNNRGSVVGSCWDTETSGLATSSGGSGRTTAEMQAASTFTGWTPNDENPVWTIDEGKDHPRLHWENEPGRDLTEAQFG